MRSDDGGRQPKDAARDHQLEAARDEQPGRGGPCPHHRKVVVHRLRLEHAEVGIQLPPGGQERGVSPLRVGRPSREDDQRGRDRYQQGR